MRFAPAAAAVALLLLLLGGGLLGGGRLGGGFLGGGLLGSRLILRSRSPAGREQQCGDKQETKREALQDDLFHAPVIHGDHMSVKDGGNSTE